MAASTNHPQRSVQHRTGHLWLHAAWCGMVMSTLACGGADRAIFAPTGDQHQLLISVRLSERAFNLTLAPPYNTVQLHATALLADSTTAPGTVQFRSTAPDKFIVDSTGLITAISSTQDGGVYRVLASVTYAGVTRRDTAFVCVTDQAPLDIRHVDILSGGVRYDTIPSTDLDGAIFGTGPANVFGGFSDATGTLISDPLCADVRAVDTTIIQQVSRTTGSTWAPGTTIPLIIIDTGNTWMTVETYTYGKTLRDSLFVRVHPPRIHRVSMTYIPDIVVPGVPQVAVFSPNTLTVAPGNDVVFENPCCHPPISITFDDPTGAEAANDLVVGTYGELVEQGNFLGGLNEHGGSGNIAAFQGINPPPESGMANGSEARRFTRPGRHPFHSSNGATGVIIVQ